MRTGLDKLYQSTAEFLVPLELRQTYTIIVNEALKLFGAKYGSIFLAQKDLLKLEYSTAPIVKPRKNGYTYKTFRTGRLFVLGRKTILQIHPEFKNQKINSFTLIPLQYRKIVIGVLVLQSAKKEDFILEHMPLLRLFGSMASLAIRKAQLYEETMKALKLRDLFISLASHELKTPLTVIFGYAQIIQNRVLKKKPVDVKTIETLTREVFRFTLLVDELLEIDQIKLGKFKYNMKPSSLKLIINRAKLNFQIANVGRKILIDDKAIKNRDKILADFDKILQVINNLLNNAAKFSPPKSPVSLIMMPMKDCFLIRIKDEGIGIPKHELPRIWKGFYKAKNNKKRGMGLGLHITKTIIDRHKGKINIYSEIGKGTTVEVELPRHIKNK